MRKLKHFFGIFAALSIFFGMMFGMPEPAAAQDLESVTLRGTLVSGMSQSERTQLVDDYYQKWSDAGLSLDGNFVVDPTVTWLRVEGPVGDIDQVVDDITGDARIDSVTVFERQDIASRTFSGMDYHAEPDARSESPAPSDADELVRLFVAVELDSGLTNSQLETLGDDIYTSMTGAGLGGTFVVDPTVTWVEMEGKSSDVEKELDNLNSRPEVDDLRILSEEYPGQRIHTTYTLHTLTDTRF